MFAALFYLQLHSVKNRLVMRLKRLKQPKYLVGLIFGAFYFYFYFFRLLRLPFERHGRAAQVTAAIPTNPLFYESVAALILFGIVLLFAWIVPNKRAALAFTEAEVAFLFPAPISRRNLIHFKLIRSQLAILFAALFLTLLSTRAGGGRWLIRALGWWVILFTLNLHFLASSFALTRLMDRGLSTWKRRVVVLGILMLGIGIVVGWAFQSIPELRASDVKSISAFTDYFDELLVSGPLPYLLFPFRVAVRPYLATDWIAFLIALGPALLLMLVHYVWVIRADVAFEEASVEASKKLAEKIAAARSRNWQGARKDYKKKRAPFKLQPRGWPLLALLWKNLISAGSAFTARIWISIAVALTIMALALRGAMAHSNWTMVIGMFAGTVCFWALLIGPQIVRQDFRQDLPNMDLLKGFPMPGWQIALGQVLAPAVVLTAIHWLLLIVAIACACAVPESVVRIPRAFELAVGAAAAMVLPGLNLISLLIPNGSVLLFPGWFQTGRDGPAGIEAMGQRLVFALGQFLAYMLSIVPAVAAFLGVYFLVSLAVGPLSAVIAASIASAVVLLAEASLGIMLLGWLFERFDVSKESASS